MKGIKFTLSKQIIFAIVVFRCFSHPDNGGKVLPNFPAPHRNTAAVLAALCPRRRRLLREQAANSAAPAPAAAQ